MFDFVSVTVRALVNGSAKFVVGCNWGGEFACGSCHLLESYGYIFVSLRYALQAQGKVAVSRFVYGCGSVTANGVYACRNEVNTLDIDVDRRQACGDTIYSFPGCMPSCQFRCMRK